MFSFSIGQNVLSCVTPPIQMKVAKRLMSMNHNGTKIMMTMMTSMKTTFCSMMSQISLIVTPTLTMMMPMIRNGLLTQPASLCSVSANLC